MEVYQTDRMNAIFPSKGWELSTPEHKEWFQACLLMQPLTCSQVNENIYTFKI